MGPSEQPHPRPSFLLAPGGLPNLSPLVESLRRVGNRQLCFLLTLMVRHPSILLPKFLSDQPLPCLSLGALP